MIALRQINQEAMMKAMSNKRQTALAADTATVRRLYTAACHRWGTEQVDKNLTMIWNMRCIEGMQGTLPFTGGLVGTTLGELLYVARELCGLGKAASPTTPACKLGL